MKQVGYMMVKCTKRSVLNCLFNESKEDLEWSIDACGFKGVEVLPCYEDASGSVFVEKDERMIKV